MEFNEILSSLSVSDIVQIIGIIVSFLTSVVAILISLMTMHQNSKMIEESSRAVISIYSRSINTGRQILYVVVKNFGNSTAVISKFDYDYGLAGCYYVPTDRDYLKGLAGASFAPGQSRSCCIDCKKITRPITFTIEYKSGRKKYRDSITLDLRAGANLPHHRDEIKGTDLNTLLCTLQEMLQEDF